MLPVNIIKAAAFSKIWKSKYRNGDFCCLDTPIDWTHWHNSMQPPHSLQSPTLAHTNTLKPQHLKLSSLSPNTPGNVFLLWGGLSGVVHWSQPSVINCHNASKLTNGLCVKEGPLIYWPPLVDPEPIISITAGFHVWASSPAKPRFLRLTLHRFPGTWRKALCRMCLYSACRNRPSFSHVKVSAGYEPTHAVCFWH